MANSLFELYRLKALDPIACLYITAVADNGSGLVQVTTSKNHCLATSDVVGILGVTGTGGLPAATNGTWTITKVSGTTFDLQGSTFAGAYTSGGNVILTDVLLKKLAYIVRWGVGSSGEGYMDDIKACLVNTSGAGTLYTPNLATDEFLSDIPSGAIISTSGNLTNKAVSTGSGGTLVGGIADCDDIVFTLVGPPGTTIETFVVYKDTGDPTTSPLIYYVDTATGLPVTANGGNITAAIDNGANRLFNL